MFYRRKIILSLLQLFSNELDKIKLQKLLFLFSLLQKEPEYDFIPYKYGCYSQSAAADIDTLIAKGIITDGEKKLVQADKKRYFEQLNPQDQKSMLAIKDGFGGMTIEELMRYVYTNYPFYAINSIAAPKILNKKELKKVEQAKPIGTKKILFTIGYEGISLEAYLVRLIRNDVKVLVDVRNNPLSMKYGFSKSQLRRNCEKVGITYVHFPEVGIQSDQRRELKNQDDYDKLFVTYRNVNLISTTNTQKDILALLNQNDRIALTCFEANICQCHRKLLAEAIEQLPGFMYEVKHI